jgi:DNA repair exonuclease SbcCD nuclease subunit
MSTTSNFLLFSDLHCHCHKRKNERLEDCLKTLDWVFETARKNNISNILFGGDLFHDRQKIEIYTYQKTFEILKKNLASNSFKLYLVLGNHDLWFNEKTSISSVVPLSSLPGVEIIFNPCRKVIDGVTWDFIPFTHNPIDALEFLKTQSGEPQYALGHLAIDGACLHGSHTSDVAIEHDGDMVSISPALFDSYIHVFLGHYHKEQKIGSNLEYIGSPLELSFGECFQEKHIIIFDGIKNKKKYIVNDFSPKHLVISPDEIDKHDLKGNFVRLKIEDMSSADLMSMRKEIIDQNALASLEIKQERNKQEHHVIKDATSILSRGSEMLSAYLDEVGTNSLEKEKLLEVGKKICQYEEN